MSVVTCSFQYSKVRELGRGSFGVVHLIDDPQLKGQFAAKEIPKHKFKSSAFSTLYAEAQRMQLASCPHVAEIRAAGESTDHITLIMPFYRKGSIADRIAINPLPLLTAIRVGQDMLFGLASIHRAGIMHFDIKPSNVLFDSQDRALIADFGQAGELVGGLAAAREMYHWGCPPEVATSFSGSQASDVFQVGLTLYRAVNGEPHYENQRSRYPVTTAAERTALLLAIQRGRFPNRSAFLPHVPASFRRVIRKALQIDPAKRYQTADEFSNALGRVEIPLNWVTTVGPGGDVQWNADRNGQASLAVSRSVRSGGLAVEVFTVSGGVSRKKQESRFWRKSLTDVEAATHLETVFSQLP